MTEDGEDLRTPAMFRQPVLVPGLFLVRADKVQQGTVSLLNTNETFHPVIRYRHFCRNHERLGATDKLDFAPKNMTDWTWPLACKDGRIGAGEPIASDEPMVFSRLKDGTKIELQESPMGKYEKWYLAMYDQDPGFHKRDGNV